MTVEIDEGQIETYLQNPLLWFSEVATGVLASDKKDLILTGGQLIQGAIKLDFWQEFLYQLKERRLKGKTKRNFYQSRNGRISLNELFNYINKHDTPEEAVFKAVQSIFLNSIDIRTDEKEEIKAYHFLQTCKKLHSIDVLVLMSAYNLYRKHPPGKYVGVGTEDAWDSTIARELNVPLQMAKQSRNQHSGSGSHDHPLLFFVYNHSNSVDIPNFGLTKLGIELAEYIWKGSA